MCQKLMPDITELDINETLSLCSGISLHDSKEINAYLSIFLYNLYFYTIIEVSKIKGRVDLLWKS